MKITNIMTFEIVRIFAKIWTSQYKMNRLKMLQMKIAVVYYSEPAITTT